MNPIRLAIVATSAALLSGCWFVFIPGSVVGAVTDSITGAEGQNCVGANVKVGDRIRTPGGGRATVKSLSGTSIRCTNPEHPIRALLVYDEEYQSQGQPYQDKQNCDLRNSNGEARLVCP